MMVVDAPNRCCKSRIISERPRHPDWIYARLWCAECGGVATLWRTIHEYEMTKSNEDTLDPVTNDDSLADVPRESLDPVQCDEKSKRKRKPRVPKKQVDAKG